MKIRHLLLSFLLLTCPAITAAEAPTDRITMHQLSNSVFVFSEDSDRYIVNVLALWAQRFGPENLFVWMSSPSESNQLISPEHFKARALPYHIAYHDQLRDLGIKHFGFHICGNQNLNLPILAESSPWINPSVLSFGHEVDLEAAIQYFPRDIIFENIE